MNKILKIGITGGIGSGGVVHLCFALLVVARVAS